MYDNYLIGICEIRRYFYRTAKMWWEMNSISDSLTAIKSQKKRFAIDA